MIVAGKRQHAPVPTCSRRVGVLEHIAAAVDTRSLAVPHRKDAVVFGAFEHVDLLRSPDAGRGQVLIESWLEADVMAFEELRKKYLPTVDPDNTIAFAGYGQVASMAEILRRCGDELTRANVLKHATTLAGFHSPYFLDGVTYDYTPDDYTPMKTLFISTFNGKDWDISDKPMSE